MSILWIDFRLDLKPPDVPCNLNYVMILRFCQRLEVTCWCAFPVWMHSLSCSAHQQFRHNSIKQEEKQISAAVCFPWLYLETCMCLRRQWFVSQSKDKCFDNTPSCTTRHPRILTCLCDKAKCSACTVCIIKAFAVFPDLVNWLIPG